MKRQARVQFTGVSSLPREKAEAMADCIQQTILRVVNIYNACDDPKITIEDRYKNLDGLHELSSYITRLVGLVREEQNQVKPEQRSVTAPRVASIEESADMLARLIPQYNVNSDRRAQTAKDIFDHLLRLVDDTIQFLSSADQLSIDKILEQATKALSTIRRVRDVQVDSDLLSAAQDCSNANVELVKRMLNRVQVMSPEVRPQVNNAIETVRSGIGHLIVAKRAHMHDLSGGSELALQTTLDSLVGALKVIITETKKSLNFSVDFEVEYYSDALGISLAQLAASVEQADAPGVSLHARNVTNEVAKQVALGREIAALHAAAKREDILEACQTAELAGADVVKYAHEALHARQANLHGAPTQTFFEAERKMNEAAKRTRAAVDLIPVERPLVINTERSQLLTAAKRIVKDLNLLLAPIQ